MRYLKRNFLREAILITTLLPLNAPAEDLQKILTKVSSLVETKNFPKALEELTWARKEIEKLHLDKIKTYFPDSVEEYKGGTFKNEGSFGFSNISREYKKDDDIVTFSLTGGTGGKDNPLAGLAGLGRLAALSGGQEEAFRIKGFTASNDNEGQPALTVFLEGGTSLKIEGPETASPELLKKMAESIQLEDLDKYLRGQ